MKTYTEGWLFGCNVPLDTLYCHFGGDDKECWEASLHVDSVQNSRLRRQHTELSRPRVISIRKKMRDQNVDTGSVEMASG